MTSSVNLEAIQDAITPTISVIIRTIGRLDSLVAAIDSVLFQSYTRYEIIIVEDGGYKVSNLISEKYNEFRNKIKYVPIDKKVGRSRAGNIGLKNSRGKYCIFLDDDDLFYPNHLMMLVKNLFDTEISYSIAHEVGVEYREGRKIYTYPYLMQKIYDQSLLMYFNFIPINCVLFPREAFEKYGGFDESLEYLEDWDLWARYSCHYKFRCNNEVTCAYTVPYNLIEYFRRMFLLKKYSKIIQQKISVYMLDNSNMVFQPPFFIRIFTKFHNLFNLIISRIARKLSKN